MNWDLVWDHKDFSLPATAFILGRPRLVRYGHLHFLLLGHRVVWLLLSYRHQFRQKLSFSTRSPIEKPELGLKVSSPTLGFQPKKSLGRTVR